MEAEVRRVNRSALADLWARPWRVKRAMCSRHCSMPSGERSEPFAYNGHHKMETTVFALGNKSGGFCEAVNCEQSEQEGKFLFATWLFTMSGSIPWKPPFSHWGTKAALLWGSELRTKWARGEVSFCKMTVPILWFRCFRIGEQKRHFCEAVNCERSEKEGKFLFAIWWFPFYGSHHILRPHGTMQGKAQRVVVPFYNPL